MFQMRNPVLMSMTANFYLPAFAILRRMIACAAAEHICLGGNRTRFILHTMESLQGDYNLSCDTNTGRM